MGQVESHPSEEPNGSPKHITVPRLWELPSEGIKAWKKNVRQALGKQRVLAMRVMKDGDSILQQGLHVTVYVLPSGDIVFKTDTEYPLITVKGNRIEMIKSLEDSILTMLRPEPKVPYPVLANLEELKVG